MTPLRLRKIARDIWTARARVAMMIAAISVSILAVGAFLGARAIIEREMTSNYRETHPASATLKVPSGIDQDTLDTVRGQPGILDAAARGSMIARVNVGDGRWQILVLFVSDPTDPQHISTVHMEQGSWPPPADGLILERTALEFFGVETGDSVLVQGPTGEPTSLRIVGSAHDGGVAPAEQERTGYGYISTAGLARLGEPTILTDLKIVVGDQSGPTGDRGAVERVAQDIGKTLASRGMTVDHIEVPPPLRHPHQGQMVTVGIVLLAFGLMALLLSSILAATMLGGMLAAQVRQIGAMKAVGARTGQILGMYLLLTTLIAAAATGLALVPGMLVARTLAGVAASILNLELYNLAIPGWVLIVQIAAGLVVPLMVALVPLARGSRVTVREAINDYGVDKNAAGGTRIEKWLGRVRGPSRSQLLALRNMFRRKGRLALTVGLLTVAGSMFLTGLNTAAAWARLTEEGIAHRQYDLEVRLHQPVGVDKLTRLIRQAPGVVDAEAWGREDIAVSRPGRIDVSNVYPDDSHGSFTMMAPPPDTELMNLPLMAGRWLIPTDTDAVVLNHLVPASLAPGVKVGDTIQLTVAGHPSTWHVVGIASDFGTQGAAYVTDHAFAQATGRPGQADMVRVVTDHHDPDGRQATLSEVERVLADNEISVEQTVAVDELKAALDGHVLVLADALIGIGMLMGFVGLLGLASTMTTNVIERTREFAVLHVIGAKRSAVRAIVVNEGLLIGAFSILFAALAALPLTGIFGDFIGKEAFLIELPFQFSAPALLVWTVLALAGAAGAAAGASRRASRLTVREALITI